MTQSSSTIINRSIAYLLFFGCALLPGFAYALDFSFEPRVQAGVLDYAFEQKPIEVFVEGQSISVTATDGTEVTIPPGETYTDSNGSTITNGPSYTYVDDGFKLISLMPLVGAGATIFTNRFFLDFYFQKALSGSDTASNHRERLESSVPSLIDPVIDSDFDRAEYSLSFGYSLSDQWILFTGYRKAKTSFSDSISYDDTELISGDDVITTRRSEDRNISFNQDGFFLGSTYAYPFLEEVTITFSAAVAVLEGEYDSRGRQYIENSRPSDTQPDVRSRDTGFDQKGDTVGLNLGVAWKGRIADSIGYSVGLDGYSYDFKAKTVDVPDISEAVLRLSAGLSYQF